MNTQEMGPSKDILWLIFPHNFELRVQPKNTLLCLHIKANDTDLRASRKKKKIVSILDRQVCHAEMAQM